MQNKTLKQFGKATLPKEQILRLQSDFQQIRSEGKYRGGRLMTIGTYRADDIGLKIGFITSKRVHKHAVKRNRARRQLKESLRLIKANLDPNLWMVIIAKSTILKATTAEVQSELIYLTKKINAFSE
ncbi:MAG: ribonuclease P protein component [Lentisphaeria bacterium]|nr:ribonuclease P protein component [Lentisphaeria bacterium]